MTLEGNIFREIDHDHGMTMRDIPDAMNPDTVTVAIRMKLDTREMIVHEASKRKMDMSSLIRHAIRYAMIHHLDLSKIEDPDAFDIGILRGVTMTFKISNDFLAKWDKYIEEFHMNRSPAIRRAMYHFIRLEKPKETQMKAKVFRIKL